MSHLTGIVLALAVGWNGTNGFDPEGLLLIPKGDVYEVDPTPEFVDWFMQDPAGNAELVRYLVRCAVVEGKTITLGSLWKWPGKLGLGGPITTFKIRRGERRARILPVGTPQEKEAGLWVSACILAHANMRSYHQFISIRGNPSSSSALKPKAGERWTEGYPEGVFFGGLFDPPAEAGEDLKAFTLSMNLSSDPAEAARCRPPNAVLGRTLDYDQETRVKGGTVRVAQKLGTHHGNLGAFRASANPMERDPDYAADEVCTDAQGALATCPPPSGGRILRPLFVHLPRLANLEAAQKTPPASEAFQVLDNGKKAIDQQQVKHCSECVGPVAYLSAGGTPSCPPDPGPGGKLVDLSKDQALEAVLRFIPELEVPRLTVNGSGPFTAVIRYACKNRKKEGCKARVRRLPQAGSDWIDAGDTWPMKRPRVDYQWLQVYPVYLHGEGAKAELRIRIEGMDGVAPELDAVGFVPGKPQCDGQFEPIMKPDAPPDAPFMGICRYQ